MKKTFFIFFILLLLLATPVFAVLGTAKSQSLAFLEGDAETGKIITQFHSDEALPIASLTKLMTYLLVMEHLTHTGSLEDLVATPDWAVDYTEASFLLDPGEKVSVKQLLEALMIVSANDAAGSLAFYVSGSREEFVGRMNERAAELGLHSAVFYNPSGLAEGDQVNRMSAGDLFTLYRYLIDHFPQVLEIEKMDVLDVPERNFLRSSAVNKVFTAIPQIDSGKTGFIDESGFCFAGSGMNRFNVETENYRFIVVVLGSPSPEGLISTLKEVVQYVNIYFHKSRVQSLIRSEDLHDTPEPWQPSFYFKIRNLAFGLTL